MNWAHVTGGTPDVDSWQLLYHEPVDRSARPDSAEAEWAVTWAEAQVRYFLSMVWGRYRARGKRGGWP
jgi:hypothetical protein